MMRWSWWLRSDSGLAARVAIGAGLFILLATIDLARQGRRATRWREYAFLLLATAFAMAYGVVNDRIASDISWEYFYYGKDLQTQLGPATPPDPAALHQGAIAVGLRATWTAGLLIGAILLMANNPNPRSRPLPYRKLVSLLVFVGIAPALAAPIMSLVASHGWLNWTNTDLAGIWRENLFRPHRFLAVYGMNLGGYVGGAVGTLWAVLSIRRLRRSPAYSLVAG